MEMIKNTAMKIEVYILNVDLRVVVPALDQTIRVGMLKILRLSRRKYNIIYQRKTLTYDRYKQLTCTCGQQRVKKTQPT